MQEPKKYTAKEAMHWMIDNPTLRMTCCNDLEDEKYIHFADGVFYTENLFLAVKLRGTFYVRAEYDAWQAALKSEAERISSLTNEQEGTRKTVAVGSECIGLKAEDKYNPQHHSVPEDGESLRDYMRRDFCDFKKQSELEDSRQRWIESYVQREIAKAEEER